MKSTLPTNNSGVFRQYAGIYNLLHHDKNYETEVRYLSSLIEKYSNIPANSILDIGCGTGNHDRAFAAGGFKVTGIDQSPEMIEEAKKLITGSNPEYFIADACSFALKNKFDVVVSLFHSICYQTEDKNLIRTIRNVYDHLNKGGLFIFDFWYGPGVLADQPVSRVKNGEDDLLKVTRKSTPQIFPELNRVDVTFEFTIADKVNQSVSTMHELHKVRYLFYPELKLFLESAGFSEVVLLEWLSADKEPENSSWNACIVATK